MKVKANSFYLSGAKIQYAVFGVNRILNVKIT